MVIFSPVDWLMKRITFLLATGCLLGSVTYSQTLKQTQSLTESESNKERHVFKRTKERLLAFPRLIVWIPDCDFKMDFKVVSFDCFIQSRKENFSFRNQGANYSRELMDALKELQPGDHIYFDHIVCLGPDHLKRNLASTQVIIIP